MNFMISLEVRYNLANYPCSSYLCGAMPCLTEDLLHALEQAEIETRVDATTRTLYSTDASIYQIEPLGVAFPRTLDQLCAIVELAARYETPVIARGAGSGLAGQAIGEGLIVDCSRYLNAIRAIEPGEDGRGLRHCGARRRL